MFQREPQHRSSPKSTSGFSKNSTRTNVTLTRNLPWPAMQIQAKLGDPVIDQTYLNHLTSLPAITSPPTTAMNLKNSQPTPFTVLGLIKDGKFIPHDNSCSVVIGEKKIQENHLPISTIHPLDQVPLKVIPCKPESSTAKLQPVDSCHPVVSTDVCLGGKALFNTKPQVENNNNLQAQDTLRLLLTSDTDCESFWPVKQARTTESAIPDNCSTVICKPSKKSEGNLLTLEALLRETDVNSLVKPVNTVHQSLASKGSKCIQDLSPPACTHNSATAGDLTYVKRSPIVTYSRKAAKQNNTSAMCRPEDKPSTLISLLNSSDESAASKSPLSPSQPLDLSIKPRSKLQYQHVHQKVVSPYVTQTKTASSSTDSLNEQSKLVKCCLKSNHKGISVESPGGVPSDTASLASLSDVIDLVFPITVLPPSKPNNLPAAKTLNQNAISSADIENFQFRMKPGNRQCQPVLLSDLLNSPTYEINCLKTSSPGSAAPLPVRTMVPDITVPPSQLAQLKVSTLLNQPAESVIYSPQNQPSTKRKIVPPAKCVDPSCCPTSAASENTLPKNSVAAIGKKPPAAKKPKLVKQVINHSVSNTSEKSTENKDLAVTKRKRKQLTLEDIMADIPEPKSVSQEKLDELDRLSREAMKLITDRTGTKFEIENTINNLSSVIRDTFPESKVASKRKACLESEEDDSSYKMANMSPTRPLLTSDNIKYIKELCPPDNQCLPDSHIRDIRLIRPAIGDYMDPETTTLRCISNHNVNLNDKTGLYRYQVDSRYQTPVEYLPVPSIWTPQHALMNVAPCISSPGFYQRPKSTPDLDTDILTSGLSNADDLEFWSTTDSEEETAIY